MECDIIGELLNRNINELALQIFLHLDFQSLHASRQVHSQWNQFIKEWMFERKKGQEHLKVLTKWVYLNKLLDLLNILFQLASSSWSQDLQCWLCWWDVHVQRQFWPGQQHSSLWIVSCWWEWSQSDWFINTEGHQTSWSSVWGESSSWRCEDNRELHNHQDMERSLQSLHLVQEKLQAFTKC